MRRRVASFYAVICTSAAVLLLTGACRSNAILESQHVGPSQTQPLAGVSYYLPKKVISVSVWEYEVTVAVRASDLHGAGAGTAAGTAQADPDLIELPAKRWFAMYDGEEIVPDLRHQFRIVPRWDVASHDLIQVKITEEGLLTSVRGRAQDQRAEIVGELAKLASLLIRGPAPMPTTMRGIGDADRSVPRMVAEYEFDPVDPVDFDRVQRALHGYRISLTLGKQSDCPTATSGAGCCTTCTSTSPGIYYRLPVPYRLNLRPGGFFRAPGLLGASATGEWECLDGGLDRTVLLPNTALCLYVPVDRKMFVTSQTSMTFDRGMLRSVTTDKPSELLGFVKIPVDVASTILAIPSELLTLRIQRTSHGAGISEGDPNAQSSAALRSAELELLAAIQKYQQAKAGKGGDDGN